VARARVFEGDWPGFDSQFLEANVDSRDFKSSQEDGLDRHAIPAEMPEGIIVREDSIAQRFLDLGLPISAGVVLPRNFMTASADDFIFESSTPTIRKLAKLAQMELDVPGTTQYFRIHENDDSIIAPVIAFAHPFLLDGGAVLAVEFLKEYANHVRANWGAKKAKSANAVFTASVVDGDISKSVTYKGPIEGLPSIVDAMTKVFGGDEASVG